MGQKESAIANRLTTTAKYQSVWYTKDEYKLLSNGEGVIIDIKNIVDNPTWRL